MINELLMLMTAIWVLIGATLIMPYFANRKMTKPGGKIDKLEKGFHNRLDRMESKFDRVNSKMIPVDIPTKEDLNKISTSITDNFIGNLKTFEANLPLSIHAYMVSKEFDDIIQEKARDSRFKALSAVGVDAHKLAALGRAQQRGMEAAEQVLIEQVNDPNNHAEDVEILRNGLKLAASRGWIEEEDVDETIGFIRGTMQLINQLKERGTSGNGKGQAFSSPSLPSKGSELEGYYR